MRLKLRKISERGTDLVIVDLSWRRGEISTRKYNNNKMQIEKNRVSVVNK